MLVYLSRLLPISSPPFFCLPLSIPCHHFPTASLSFSLPAADSKLQTKLNLACSQTAVEYSTASKRQCFHFDSSSVHIMMSMPHETAWKLQEGDDMTYQFFRDTCKHMRIRIIQRKSAKNTMLKIKNQLQYISCRPLVGEDVLRDAKRGCEKDSASQPAHTAAIEA